MALRPKGLIAVRFGSLPKPPDLTYPLSSIFTDDPLHPVDGLVVVAQGREDLAQLQRVLLLLVRPPAQVSRAPLRVAGPRELPTSQVVCASGQWLSVGR